MDSLREIPFEVLGWAFSWISEGERSVINQVCKNFQLIIEKKKFKVQLLTAMSSIGLLQWSQRNRLPLEHRDVIRASIVNGKLDIMRFLVTILKYHLPYDSCTWAVEKGHLHILRALRSGELGEVCPWSEYTCECAAAHGHLEILRALRSGELGGVCPWNERTCEKAAKRDRLEVLKALRSGELGGICPWDKWSCAHAAREGQIEILRLLRSGELGGVCPWDREECLEYYEDYQAVLDLIQ